jgi:hypothetical protein
VPTKFVNLSEFCEFKIPAQVEMQILFAGSADIDGVVPGVDAIDVRPEQELAVGEVGDGHAGVVEGKQLFRAEAPFAIEQIAVGDAKGEVDETGPKVVLLQHEDADAEEKDDLDDPEEEVDPWQLAKDITTGQNEEENVQGDQQLAPEIDGRGFFVAKMTEGVGQDEEPGEYMQPGSAAFQPFEGGMDDRKGDGVHAGQFWL